MKYIKLSTVVLGSMLLVSIANADIVHNDDVIIAFSQCVGNDCVNGENFGFDTVRLKENNLRIKFQDTSSSASFPTNDWQLTANDSSNGGANKFSIDDVTGSKTPFTVEAGAPTNALYVDSNGNVGLTTANPVVELHIVDGNSPTIRLEQDGSSGFTPQTWDVAGNEANFFIRDATNGSQLPFRIKPGADSGSLFIAADNDVGVGTESPDAQLDILSNEIAALKVANSTGGVNIQMDSGDTGNFWNITAQADAAGGFLINNNDGPGSVEFSMDTDGNVTIEGQLVTAANTYPDYVFRDGYELMGLDDLESFIDQNGHLPKVPSEDEFNARGRKINVSSMQMLQLEKIEELTLYMLSQQKTIDELQNRLAELETK